MFDFGEELTVESYKVPWLIWVQVFVMFLLILLLYCLALISSDPIDYPNPNSSSSSSSSRLVSKDKTHIRDFAAISNLSQNTQVEEIQSRKGEIEAGTSRRVVRRREDFLEDQSDHFAPGLNMYFQPCYYVRLARMVFLKCLGLDSSSESSSTTQRRKKKEE